MRPPKRVIVPRELLRWLVKGGARGGSHDQRRRLWFGVVGFLGFCPVADLVVSEELDTMSNEIEAFLLGTQTEPRAFVHIGGALRLKQLRWDRRKSPSRVHNPSTD